MHRKLLLAFLVLLGVGCFPAFGSGTQESGIALVGGRIFDGNGGPPIEGGVVLISGAEIRMVGRSDQVAVPNGFRVYDVAGKSVLPGFINAHVHNAYDSDTLHKWLQAGVTSVRDLGPFWGGDFLARRDELNRDPLNARLISATPLITAPGGYGSAEVASPAEGESLVRAYVKQGVDVVKIAIEDDLQGRSWNMLPQDTVTKIVQTAHSLGVRVAAHISHARNLPIAINAGVDDIAHMVVEPLDDGLIRTIVAEGIYWEPTLELWKGVSTIHSLDWDAVAGENLGRFYRAGGKIALGTDYAGYINKFDDGFPITEVSLMAKAGMSPADIIVAGTRNAAIVSGKDKLLGTLRRGKYADVLVVDGNPLDGIAALASTFMVIHGGRVAFRRP